jgi:predicted acyltransferase
MKSEMKPSDRLWSLDTLRGFDMFWIIGGDAFFRTLADVTGWGWARFGAFQLDHAEWAGFHFYDLVFPLFMFISGVAIPFSLLAKAEGGAPKAGTYGKLVKRGLILVLLGVLYNGFLKAGPAAARYPSVLGQIGLAYLFAGLIMLSVKSLKGRIGAVLAILGGYAAVQLLVPVPGIGAGVLTPEGTINGFVDRLLLPGRLYDGVFDPEGILCVLSAVSVTLLGGIAGSILRAEKGSGYRKAGIKKAWTATFDMSAAGLSFLLLALFYLVVDVWKVRKWTFFLRVIGLNSITIYLGKRLIDFSFSSVFLFGGLAGLAGRFQPVVIIVGTIAVEWVFLYFLYKKKIFLRV